MRALLNARPELEKCGCVHASADDSWGSGTTEAVVDVTVDTVVVHEVPWAERVGVVCKGAVLDALSGAGAVAAEAVDGVEDDGFGEGTGVEAFFPVAVWWISRVSSPPRLEKEA